jgi:hypothetical protein
VVAPLIFGSNVNISEYETNIHWLRSEEQLSSLVSLRSKSAKFICVMNLHREQIKANIVFVSLQSAYFKAKLIEYCAKELHIAKLNVNSVESG